MPALALQQPDLCRRQSQVASRDMSKKRLTDAGVQNHNSLVGLYGFANLHHLLEELGFLLMSTRRIHDDDIETLLLEFRHTLRGDCDRIGLRVRAEICNLGLRCGLSGLIEGSGTEGIRTDNT